MNLFQLLIGLSIPMIFAGVLHMAVVRFNVMAWMAVPISTSLFGKNKTWRGFVVMPLLGILGVHLANYYDAAIFLGTDLYFLGAVQGFFYALFELPNSWWKRRKKIDPGKLPETGKLLHAIVDQADSVIGCALVYLAMLTSVSVSVFLVLIVFGTFVHLLFNYLLFLAGLRKEPI